MNIHARSRLVLLATASLAVGASIIPAETTAGEATAAYTALEPQRLLDTRSTEPVGSADDSGESTRITVAGRAGVPTSDVEAVALNVTVVNATVAGYATVYDCDERPMTSNLNFGIGSTVANLAVTSTSDDGEVCVFVRGRGDLLVDVLGYFPTAAGYTPIDPARLVDTRTSAPLTGGETLTVDVTAHRDIPADATAVTLTVTAVEAAAAGFATVYPCGDRPNASNLNFAAGQTVANSVITALSPSGEVCIFSDATTDILVDVVGHLGATASLQPAAPLRIVDTRDSGIRFGTAGGDGDPLEINVGGVGRDSRARLGAVAMNVTVVDALDAGHLTVYPCGVRPEASNLNFSVGQTIANAVIAPVSESGTVCIHARGRVHLLVDSTSTVQDVPPTTTPPPDEPLLRDVAATREQTCVLFTDGRIKCWGSNFEAQLGLGDTTDRGDEPGEMGDALPFVDVDMDPVSMSDGRAQHNCVIDDEGRVKCWGRNGYGELGLGDTTNRGDKPGQMGEDLPFVNLGPGRTAKQIEVGEHHTCAILDNDELKCWGYNNRGQLGIGDVRESTESDTPDELPAVDLGTGRHAVDISPGDFHTCALLDNGAVKCWGWGSSGRLGLGDTTDRGGSAEMGDNLPAVDLGAGRTAVSIAAGRDHTCALLDNGAVKCWGDNGDGQLGLGDTDHRGDDEDEMGNDLPAVDLGDGRTAVTVSAGGYHNCALLDDDTLKCWGLGSSGQLGLGDTNSRGDDADEMGNDLPDVDLGDGRTAVAISAGGEHNCALLDNDTVKCWGSNGAGRLGLGDRNNRGDEANEMGDDLPAVLLIGSSP